MPAADGRWGRVVVRRLLDPLPVAVAPFLAGKVISLLVPSLTVWSTSRTPRLPSWAELAGPFAAWDAQAYMAIAANGYPAGPLDLVPGHPGHLWAYFPGFPLLLAAVRLAIPDMVMAGLVLNSALELVALAYLARLVTLERDEQEARFATWMLAVYPYAIFLTTLYTESGFLAAACASLYHMRRGRRGDHLRACIAAALAVAIRPTGLALVPALIADHLGRRRRRALPGIALTAITIIPLAAFAGVARVLTGDPLAYLHAENSASFSFMHVVWPWTAAVDTWRLASSTQPASYTYLFALDLVFATLGLLVLAGLWWRVRRRQMAPSLAIYATAVWLLTVSVSFWLSTPRFLIALVPGYLLAADLVARRPRLAAALVTVSAGLMAFTASTLATGRFVA